jgi:hypothetical protein
MGVYHGIFGIFYISALLEPNCSNLLKLIDTVAASFALETAGFYFLSVPVGLFFNLVGLGWRKLIPKSTAPFPRHIAGICLYSVASFAVFTTERCLFKPSFAGVIFGVEFWLRPHSVIPYMGAILATAIFAYCVEYKMRKNDFAPPDDKRDNGSEIIFKENSVIIKNPGRRGILLWSSCAVAAILAFFDCFFVLSIIESRPFVFVSAGDVLFFLLSGGVFLFSFFLLAELAVFAFSVTAEIEKSRILFSVGLFPFFIPVKLKNKRIVISVSGSCNEGGGKNISVALWFNRKILLKRLSFVFVKIQCGADKRKSLETAERIKKFLTEKTLISEVETITYPER